MCDHPRDKCRMIRNGHDEVIAEVCCLCGETARSMCPVCEQWFADAVHHQRSQNYGCCGFFMDRGMVKVSAAHRMKYVEIRRRNRKAELPDPDARAAMLSLVQEART